MTEWECPKCGELTDSTSMDPDDELVCPACGAELDEVDAEEEHDESGIQPTLWEEVAEPQSGRRSILTGVGVVAFIFGWVVCAGGGLALHIWTSSPLKKSLAA